ncbi:16S rRNA (cytidine(1402)-2'-O)-methyltransferase [Bowdeniella nasicola]|uniref:Ribosomal RNA small subunit methyltransferase I n=1 Tax=Bowdeniella nasicola TaxID=208480 RepID=A0A1Q5Q2P2_9ACTO|nr:16S rRNA (cytidine(1402)-2'-O)-methyltransferase [Bowdeniella nasicola]OKL54101.1 16S rRNA (cytidine(1402)-2'-O)-methyltransferase [Bowdeniella nasicola]
MRISPLAPGITLAATPIGNLADASFRLLAALGQADVIAAEDTRRTRQLAAGLDVTITGRLVSFHDHNEARRADELIDAARAGERVLVVSDAGMPTISDPGYRLAARAAAEDVPLTVIPGPSAPATALAASGLPTDAFAFDGFLPRKGRDRAAALARIAAERRTVLLFESPHRIAATLADLAAACGAERRGAVARELTKLHEEVRRGTLADLADWAKVGVRGEIVIVVDGAGQPAAAGHSASATTATPGHAASGTTTPGDPASANGPTSDTSPHSAAAPVDPTQELPGFPAPTATSDISPASPDAPLDPALIAEVKQLSKLGLRMKDAAAHVASRTRVRARDLYNAAIVD